MIQFELLHPRMTEEHLGLIPHFLYEEDERSASEQFEDRYVSGWRNQEGFALGDDNSLQYRPNDPEEERDPPLVPRAIAKLRGETIVFYDYAYVAIIQPDRSFEVCRMD